MKDPEYDREASRYSEPIASRNFILQIMAGIGEPVAFKRLAKELELSQRSERDALQYRLRAMVREGQLVVDRRNVYAIASRMELVRGRISGHPDGFGFLLPEGDGEDIFLPHRQMRGVFNGDLALVRIRGMDRRGRPVGEIAEVLERNTRALVGRLYHENGRWLLESLDNRISQEILVDPCGDEEEGQIVSALIVDQPTMHGMPTCSVEEVLGDHLSTEMEIKVCLRKHEIPHLFGKQVLDLAASMSLNDTDMEHRADLTELPFVTIDGADARDFDDAIYCEARGNGGWRLIVAIADVAHYVRPGSALDEAAAERGTSVYFPQYVIPMLPPGLSNELCSLKPGVDRLVLVCDMQISAAGRTSGYQFYEGVIQSAARLTYEQVAHDDLPPGVIEQSIKSARGLVTMLLSRRKERGALDFDSTELDFEFDSAGNIRNIGKKFRNDAMQLIEECMLCANVCAARFADRMKQEVLYRVHQRPTEEKVDFLRSFLETLGIGLPEGLPTPAEFQLVLDNLRGRPNGEVLQLSVLRALSQAVYQVHNVGHFGLNYEMYAHFTSPIRRYPDLLTHRMIKSVIHGASEATQVRRFGARDASEYNYDSDDLHRLGAHCSQTERRAEAAVYEVLEWLKCQYVAGKIGETVPGVITHVTNFGFFVQLSEVFVEGLVHVSSLINDYYHFDQSGQCLVGESGGLTFTMGDDVSVQVARVSVDEQKVDLELISHQATKRNRPYQRKPTSGRRGRRRK